MEIQYLMEKIAFYIHLLLYEYLLIYSFTYLHFLPKGPKVYLHFFPLQLLPIQLLPFQLLYISN